MGHTPKYYSHDGDETNEPLYASEFVPHWPYRHDGGASSGLEGDKEEYPDEENGNDADRKGDEEPDTPARLGSHVLEGDDVLRRSNGGGSATNVRSEGDAKDEGFGKIGV